MSIEIVAIFVITVLVLAGFVFQWGTVDLVATLCLVALPLFGLIAPQDALNGFSNPATITVLAMFILSEGIGATGALNVVGHKMMDFSNGRQSVALFLLMLFVGIASMFINNTAAVALLIPVTMQIAKKSGWRPSSLLMPLSFASMVGGVCTLIGTSTNLIADSILVERGFEKFQVFSFFKYGVIFFAVGIVYILLFYKRLIPNRRKEAKEAETYELNDYLTHIKVHIDSPYVGSEIDRDDLDFQVINRIESKYPNSRDIEGGDILLVAADINSLKEFAASKHIEVLPSLDPNIQSENSSMKKLVEAVVSPDSKVVNSKLSKALLFKRFGLKVLAIRHQQEVTKENLYDMVIRAGDMLLLAVPESQLERLRNSKLFVVVREPELEIQKTKKIIPAIVIMSIVVLLSALGIAPIYISALLGVCLMVIAKILTFDEAYRAVNWRIIFLLAGLLALGKAMDKTGATIVLSESLLSVLDGYGSSAVVAGFFSLSIVLTSILSNNAAAVIMVPIAIESSKTLGMDPIKLTLVVMFAASLSFLTPIGYQTNMMVYGVGQYKFSDFMRFGGPLTIIMLLTAILVFA